jgi:predicted AlkP superfamily phosphohydrolase/phosphomutase
VIGLDGAAFEIMEPLLKNEKLPNIKNLMSNGVRANLLSTIPYATIPAWPSFMTGMNPGKHGIFDFFVLGQGGERRIVQSGDIAAKLFWEVLSDSGKRCIVVNVPCTYPPRPIKGVIVSGMLTPEEGHFCQPQGLEDFLHKLVGGYRINERADLPRDHRMISDLYLITLKQKEVFSVLLQRERWDFALWMLRGTDIVCHMFWENRSVIENFYQFVDLLIGDLLKDWPHATIFLMSDHGFQAQEKDFHINKWLIDQGLLKIRRSSREEARWNEIRKLVGRASLGEKQNSRYLSKVFQNLWITKAILKKWLPSFLWNWGRVHLPQGLKTTVPKCLSFEVDVRESKASAVQQFTMETKGILVHVPSTSPEYEKIREQVIKGLLQLRDLETGCPVVRAVHRRENIYKGPYVNQAPDIVLELEEGFNITNNFITESYITKRGKLRGCHSRGGIFVASGSELRKGVRLTEGEVYIWDLAPTILHYFKLPIPYEYDGRVLKEIFEESSETGRRDVAYVGTGEKHIRRREEKKLTNVQQKKIEDRLRNLGYLD